MIVQVYKDKKRNGIVVINKSHLSEREILEEYEFVEEVEGKDWDECNKKINSKYFNNNYKSSET